MLVVNDQLSIPLSEFQFTFSRSSGPGGQNVNKVNTKVTLRWHLAESASLPADMKERFQARYHRRINREGEVLVISQRFRDQGRNVGDCLAKLRGLLLEVAHAPTPRKPTRRTKGSRERRLKNKHQQSEKKRLRKSPGWE